LGCLTELESVRRLKVGSDVRRACVRGLMPESWGFVCAVGTPDGVECGFLNYFSVSCHLGRGRF
jgi:DNA-directed RNA polymerase beta subunit